MLAIQIIRAKGLPVKDDYFTTVNFCGEEIFCTEGCNRESNGDPVWQDADEFSLDSFNGKEEVNKRPLFLEKISIQVFADKGDRKAELVGEARIPLFNIGPPRWYKLVPKTEGVTWDAQILITLSFPQNKLEEFSNISFLPFSKVLDVSDVQTSPLFLNFGDSSLALFGANPLPGPTCGELLLDYHGSVEVEMTTGVNLFKDKCSVLCKGSLYLTDLRLVFVPNSLIPSPPGFLGIPHVVDSNCCIDEESLLATRRMTLQFPISGIQDIKCLSSTKDSTTATLRVVCRNSTSAEFTVTSIPGELSMQENPIEMKLGQSFYTGGLLSRGMPPLLWCSRMTEELKWMIREDLSWVRWAEYLGLSLRSLFPATRSQQNADGQPHGFVFRAFAADVPEESSKVTRRSSLLQATKKPKEDFLYKFHPCVLRFIEVPEVMVDYRRMKLHSDAAWNISNLNDSHELCSTYPDVLVFPSMLANAEVKEASFTRSKERLPSLVWIHPLTRTPLCRCAQPLAGISGVYVTEPDVKMCLAIRDSSRNRSKQLRILDCRPKINAHANAIQGKGFENVASLGGAEGATLVFADIHNIHVMRESLQKVRDTHGNTDSDEGGGNSIAVSKWLHHVAAVLRGAASTAESLMLEYPVLVHCSDGWDRTAQISSLAQLLLDPYYRSINGFLMLIEKDWIGFGFQFEERMGRMTDKSTSPVFTQFLDCVWQLLNQYPTEFEFSSGFLEVLMVCAYSGYFSSFRGNCERERLEELTVHAESTLNVAINIVHFSSVFTYIHILLSSGMGALLINPKYIHPGVAVKYLHPRFGVEDLTLWTQGLLPRGFSSFSQGGGRSVLSRIECDALSSSSHVKLLSQWDVLSKYHHMGLRNTVEVINGQHHGAFLGVQRPHELSSKYGQYSRYSTRDFSSYLQLKDHNEYSRATIRIQLFIIGRMAMRKALIINDIKFPSKIIGELISTLLVLFCRSRFKSCMAKYAMKMKLVSSIINDVVEFVMETCDEMQRSCPQLMSYEEGTTRGTFLNRSTIDEDGDNYFGDDEAVNFPEATKSRQTSSSSSNSKTGKTKSKLSSSFFSKIGFSKKEKS